MCPSGLTRADVALQITRIGMEVLGWTKLRGIDKDAYDDKVALGGCGFNQGGVTVVQETHRRHKADRLTGESCGSGKASHVGNGVDYLHHNLPPNSASAQEREHRAGGGVRIKAPRRDVSHQLHPLAIGLSRDPSGIGSHVSHQLK